MQRQQATAIVAAREMIVEGAVGMVKMAIRKLEEDGVVELDEERKASMVNNLMVSITSERAAQPVALCHVESAAGVFSDVPAPCRQTTCAGTP